MLEGRPICPVAPLYNPAKGPVIFTMFTIPCPSDAVYMGDAENPGATVYEWAPVVRRARLADDPDLDRDLKLYALYLSTYASPDGTRIYPGEDRAAVEMNRSRRTIARYNKTLRDLGLIEVARRGARKSGHSDEYRLILAADLLDRLPRLPTPAEHNARIIQLRDARRAKAARSACHQKRHVEPVPAPAVSMCHPDVTYNPFYVPPEPVSMCHLDDTPPTSSTMQVEDQSFPEGTPSEKTSDRNARTREPGILNLHQDPQLSEGNNRLRNEEHPEPEEEHRSGHDPQPQVSDAAAASITPDPPKLAVIPGKPARKATSSKPGGTYRQPALLISVVPDIDDGTAPLADTTPHPFQVSPVADMCAHCRHLKKNARHQKFA